MATILKRLCDNRYVATLTELPGYRHITFTRDPEKALQIDNNIAARITGSDYIKRCCHSLGEPGFIRIDIL